MARPRRKYELKATTYDKRGRVLSVAFNDYKKTHPIQAKLALDVGLDDKISLHAEVLAIIRARGKKIHKIKIERYDIDGNPKLAKPCSICEEAIKRANIKFIEYTVG